MTFITSGLAIAGVLAVAIPILIHLLARQRRTPIEWAAMRFLLEAFRKHKRRLHLEQILLLAVRCLIVALLGLALARPVLEAAGLIPAGGSRVVYLVIDDGMISGVLDEENRTALQRHVRQAADLVNTLGPGDAVGVITAARPAKAILSPPSTDHDAVVNLLQSLEPKESPTDLAGAFGFVRSAVDDTRATADQAIVYLFSEFRGGSAAHDSPLPATQAGPSDAVRLFAASPASKPINNVQIVAIEPVRTVIQPGANDGSGQITVRLARSGEAVAAADVSTVRLAGEGLPVMEPRTVRWQPGQSRAEAKFQVNVPAGPGADRTMSLTATLDEDALKADNSRHIVLELRPQIRVLLIDRRSFGFERTLDQMTAGQWIRRALEPMAAAERERGPIQIVEVEPAALDVADTRTAEVAILPRPDLLGDTGWEALRQFVMRDGLLIITPPGEVNVHPWTESLATKLQLPWRVGLETVPHSDGLGLAEDQPATEILRLISSDLADMARPVMAYRVLPVEGSVDQATGPQALLSFADGTPLAVSGVPEPAAGEGDAESVPPRGMVVYLAVSPEMSWTNLPSKPLMLPLFQELVRQGLSVLRASQQLQVGEQPNLARGPAARDLVTPLGNRIVLESSGRPQQPLDRAGVYVVQDQSDQPIGRFAVNIDAAAGVTDVNSPAAVASWLNASGPWTTFDSNDIAATLAVEHATSPIAGILLPIVLALVILETILARRFSHAYATGPGTEDWGMRRATPSGALSPLPGGQHE